MSPFLGLLARASPALFAAHPCDNPIEINPHGVLVPVGVITHP